MKVLQLILESLMKLFSKPKKLDPLPTPPPAPVKKSVEPKPVEKPKVVRKEPRPLYHFTSTSKKRLATCHPDIQEIMNEAIGQYNFFIVEGTRSKEDQEKYFRTGASKVRFPNSYHNTSPSLAIDIAPWDGRKILWDDEEKFKELATIVKRIAKKKGIPLDWGYDMWKWDLPHWQLTSYRK